MEFHVAESIKDERLQRLQALLSRQQREFAASLVGRDIELLLEKPGRMPGQRVGRSPWLQPVIVDETAGEIGDIVRCSNHGSGEQLPVRADWSASLRRSL
jgi:tRNA-2-methylthio-N6-dimethylallyladenosine synthase